MNQEDDSMKYTVHVALGNTETFTWTGFAADDESAKANAIRNAKRESPECILDVTIAKRPT